MNFKLRPIIPPVPTSDDTLAYLGAMLAEHARMARAIGRPTLAYLIGIAILEATTDSDEAISSKVVDRMLSRAPDPCSPTRPAPRGLRRPRHPGR